MKQIFIDRAKENINAAEILLNNDLQNASANRAYYAAFHAAIAAVYHSGIEPVIDHKTIQTLFTNSYFNKRKVLPSSYKKYLSELLNNRNIADYKIGVSITTARRQFKKAKEFVEFWIY